jgi:hypothetical protein
MAQPLRAAAGCEFGLAGKPDRAKGSNLDRK